MRSRASDFSTRRHGPLHVLGMNFCRPRPALSYCGLVTSALIAGLSCGRADDSHSVVDSAPPSLPDGASGSTSAGPFDSGARASEADGGRTASTDEGAAPPAIRPPGEMRWARSAGRVSAAPTTTRWNAPSI
jgi:hypothetical protein